MIDQIAHRKENENDKHMRDRPQGRVPSAEFKYGETGQRDPKRGEQDEQRTASDVAIHSKAAKKTFENSERVTHQANGMDPELRISEHSVEQESEK